MTRTMRTIALCLLAAGCGTSTERGAYTDIRASLASLAGLGRAEAPSRVTATDAELNAAPSNILLVERPSLGTQAGLVLNAINRDTITWRSPAGVDLATRGGQVVGTAGFGNDLASAAVPDISAGRGRVTRDHYHLGGDERIRRTRYDCTLATAGRRTVAVTGRAFDTVLIVETCRGPDGATFENRYWIDGSGVVRRSRQFAGAGIGYLDLADVHTGLR